MIHAQMHCTFPVIFKTKPAIYLLNLPVVFIFFAKKILSGKKLIAVGRKNFFSSSRNFLAKG
jgi:hypothetical protein